MDSLNANSWDALLQTAHRKHMKNGAINRDCACLFVDNPLRLYKMAVLVIWQAASKQQNLDTPGPMANQFNISAVLVPST
jgi:hypothetical protein